MLNTGTLLRQGMEGYDAGTDRKAMEESRQIGLDDKKFQSERRKTVASREDKTYQRDEAKIKREQTFKSAVNAGMVSGDYSKTAAALNEYSPDGYFFSINKNKDGSYSTFAKKGDGTQEEKNYKTKEELDDEIMPRLLYMGKNEPFAKLESDAKEKAARRAKAGDRKHDINKIDRKGAWDLKKAGLKEGGAGSLKGAKNSLAASRFFSSEAKALRGSSNGFGGFDFSGNNAIKANLDKTISKALYRYMDMDASEAYGKAYDMVERFTVQAEKEAAARHPDDDERQSQYVVAKMKESGAKALASIKNKSAKQADKRPTETKAKPVAANKTPTYSEFEKAFKAKNPNSTSADAKKKYGEWFPTEKQGVSGSEETAKKEKGLTERKKRETPKVIDMSFGGKARRLANNEKRKKSREDVNKYLVSGAFSNLSANGKRKWLNDNMDKLNRGNRKKARDVFKNIRSELTKRQG